MKFYLLICLLFLLAGCPVAPPEVIRLSQPARHPALEQEAITLLNWNIYKQYDQPDWQAELEQLMQRWSPDLLTLQEVNISANPATAPFPPAWGYQFGANLVTPMGGFSGVMTASRADAFTTEVLVSKVLEPVTATPKITLVTRYRLLPANKQLLVANIHGINFVDHDEFAVQLSRLEDKLAQHKGPMLFCGDFNTWSDQRLQLLARTATRLGLVAVPYPEGRKSFLDAPLDHVYHSKDLEILELALPTGYDSSDHPPMVARFRYTGTTEKE